MLVHEIEVFIESLICETSFWNFVVYCVHLHDAVLMAIKNNLFLGKASYQKTLLLCLLCQMKWHDDIHVELSCSV